MRAGAVPPGSPLGHLDQGSARLAVAVGADPIRHGPGRRASRFPAAVSSASAAWETEAGLSKDVFMLRHRKLGTAETPALRSEERAASPLEFERHLGTTVVQAPADLSLKGLRVSP